MKDRPQWTWGAERRDEKITLRVPASLRLKINEAALAEGSGVSETEMARRLIERSLQTSGDER